MLKWIKNKLNPETEPVEPYESNDEFKNQFFMYAQLIGSPISELENYVDKDQENGKKLQISEPWVLYDRTLFRVSEDGLIEESKAPISSTYGHPYEEEPQVFIMDGIKQGMTKKEVQKIWGRPTWKALLVWGYQTRGGILKTGRSFDLCVYFKKENKSFGVTHFEARLNGKKTTKTPSSKILKAFIVISCDYKLSQSDPLKIFHNVCKDVTINEPKEFAFIKISGDIDKWLANNSLVEHTISAFKHPIRELTKDDLTVEKYLYFNEGKTAHGVYVLIR